LTTLHNPEQQNTFNAKLFQSTVSISFPGHVGQPGNETRNDTNTNYTIVNMQDNNSGLPVVA